LASAGCPTISGLHLFNVPLIFAMYHGRICSLLFVFQRTIGDLYIRVYNLKRGSTLSSYQRNIYIRQVQCLSILRYGNNVIATMNSYIIILLTILQHNYNINDHYKMFWMVLPGVCLNLQSNEEAHIES
jgi:hypothetical protein